MVYLQSSLLILVLNTFVRNSKIIVQRMESQLHSAHHTTTKQIVLLREQSEHANHCGRKLLKVASVHTQHCGCTELHHLTIICHHHMSYSMVANLKLWCLVARKIFSQDILTMRIIKIRIMKGNKDKLKSMTGKSVQKKEFWIIWNQCMLEIPSRKFGSQVLSLTDQTLLENQELILLR